MEAVPRLPMISFELKVSPDRQPTDFGKLKQYIQDFYNEDPESYSGEIQKLEALRATALRPSTDVTGCSVLKKYYCQLHFLQSRFPMGKDGVASVNFTWRDTYANMVCTLADIRFEIVSILYNIGALHSYLGACDSRTSSEGLKLACTHFQCAAWAFQHLKDTYPQPAGVDLAPGLMQFMYQVCLAQAQECILEKSMTDNRKATINAKVAAQIVDYYNMSLNALTHGGCDDGSVMETVGSKLFKSWNRYVKFKQTYYSCIALLYQGQQSEEQQKMGERMAYYQAAYDKLVEASKLTKGLDHPEVIEEALTFTMDVVEGKRKAAKNENEFIYHEEVPDKDTLPEIKGAALVKGISFSINDPDISGPDIFGRLVPMKAHEASSLYSEEKAKLLRKMGALIDEKDQEIVAFMTSLQLEYVNTHLEPNILPQDIVDRCAALSAKPDAIHNLIEAMDKLSDIYQDVEAMLKEIKELIQNEELEEREYQEVMGSRPPSIVATDLTREANKYEEAHNKAAESNKTLHKAMTQHITNLRLMELPLSQLATQIPSLSALNLDQQPIVKEMQHLITKVDEMRRQRAMLATQLRESICGDDITAQLVTSQNDNLEAVFQGELQKHSKYVALIEQNLAAQNNIIKALTDTYAQYAPVRKATMEIIRQRNLTLSALMSSYDAYEDLIAKSNKGHEFYRKLETNVTKLLQRVKGTCKVQEEERDTILSKNCKTLPSKDKINESGLHTPTGNNDGPKLRDYLDNYKREKSGGYTFPTQNPGEQILNSGSFSSTKPVYSESVPTTYDSSQSWIPSVRPAPVGQEGTCPSTTPQDFQAEASYPGYTGSYASQLSNKSNNNDGSQYSQNYTDQYASYMSQYQSYSSTSSPYHMPANYQKNDFVIYPKGLSSSNLINYSPNPKLQTATPSYPPPTTPSPIMQNCPLSCDDYKVPSTLGQSCNVSTLPQTHNPVHQNNNHKYLSGQKISSHKKYPDIQEQFNPQYSTSISQTYQTQKNPQLQNCPNTTNEQYNNPLSNMASQISNYQITTGNHSSSYPVYLTSPAYSHTSINLPHHSASLTSVDQSICNNSNVVQNISSEVTTTTFSKPNPINYTMSSQNQEKQLDSEKQTYSFYDNAPNKNQNYSSPFNLKVTQPPGSSPQYSSYIPQMYNSYTNNEQFGQIHNNQPWQTSDNKNLQPLQADSQNYYSIPQYPNYSQMGSEMQYTPATVSSYYTHAGQPVSSHTSASTPQSTIPISQPNYTQGNYYYQPYGYQYTSGTVQNITPSASPTVFATHVTTQQGQMAPQSPMTYMQASNSNLKLTFSQESTNGSKSVLEENLTSSNVDLLAGLDFSLSQDPLVPQKKVSETSVKISTSLTTSDSDLVEEKLAAMALDKTGALSDTTILTPKKIADGKFQLKDPLNDTEAMNQFVQEVEKFEKFVEGLCIKTLNGPTPLDIKWKELLELQEKDSAKQSISVARCYPVKNRFSDILPYDNSRVELPSTKDDYINASYVKDVTPNFPDFIVTQSPLKSTLEDFWIMVLEQQVELIVCLLSDAELEVDGSRYWPCEKGIEMEVGKIKLSLQSSNSCKYWVERIIYVTDSRLTRVVVHLQFTDWPGSSFPSSPGPFLSLVSETLSLRSQQRGVGPCVVHCLSGVGRAGLFVLTTAAICHIHAVRTLPDLTSLAANISTWRKNALRDREHFKFTFQALLYYSQDLLMKRGILASRSSFDDKRTKSHTRHPSQDFLLGPSKDIFQPQMNSDKKLGGVSNESTVEDSADPLSQLDPLWSLKKLS